MIKNKSRSQITAIKICAVMGLRLQDELPQIAEEYMGGLSYSRIGVKHDIRSRIEKYFKIPSGKVSRSTVSTSVLNALWGYKGGFGRGPYGGLIEDDGLLREKLFRDYQKRNGEFTLERKLAVHALSQKELKENGKEGGLIGGRSNIENKTGIGKMTPADLKNAGIESAIARGYTPWTPRRITKLRLYLSELEFAHNLLFNREYWKNERKIDAIKISEKLNKEYHSGKATRTSKSVSQGLRRYHENGGLKRPYPNTFNYVCPI
jgi:hypothetical protein